MMTIDEFGRPAGLLDYPSHEEEYMEWMRKQQEMSTNEYMRRMMDQAIRNSMGGVYIPPHSRDDYERNLGIADQRRGLLHTPQIEKELYPQFIPPDPHQNDWRRGPRYY